MRSYDVFCYGTSFRVHSCGFDKGIDKHVFVLEEVDSVFDKEPLAGVKVPPAYYVVPTKYHQVPVDLEVLVDSILFLFLLIDASLYIRGFTAEL